MPAPAAPAPRTAPPALRPAEVPRLRRASAAFDLIAIGASTGGPLAVQRVLADLGPRVAVPIVVVQHMPAGFTAPFAERLDGQLALPVREAADGEALTPGTAYVAPAGRHLRVFARAAGGLEARLGNDTDSRPHRPSVDVLLLSAAAAVGARAIAILLTGMGSDGAEGMAALETAGARTLVQDEATSVVYGMPRAALERGIAHEVLPLPEIGRRARRLLDDA